jgi:hypothetical protein
MPGLRSVLATRYVEPLREGGSLPAVVEADDDGLYVVKFRGAGQGPKALVAELVSGELARALGLPVPEIVLATVEPDLGRAEPDREIQDLLAASTGVNAALDFLPGALPYNPAAEPLRDERLAADIVWFDALVTNVDRTPRNTNLLMWHRQLWMIDHGASLYVQHSWDGAAEHALGAFPAIREHVLLPVAASIAEADERLAPRVTEDLVTRLVALVPDDWLGDPVFADREAERRAYVEYIIRRATAPRRFAEEAERARVAL